MAEKKNRGPVDVFMQRESVNAIAAVHFVRESGALATISGMPYI